VLATTPDNFQLPLSCIDTRTSPATTRAIRLQWAWRSLLSRAQSSKSDLPRLRPTGGAGGFRSRQEACKSFESDQDQAGAAGRRWLPDSCSGSAVSSNTTRECARCQSSMRLVLFSALGTPSCQDRWCSCLSPTSASPVAGLETLAGRWVVEQELERYQCHCSSSNG